MKKRGPTKFRCELVTWGKILRLSRRLAFMVKESGYRPDLLIAIGRGGYVPARLLSDYLCQDNLASIRIVHYQRGAEKKETAEIRYPLNADPKGMKVLVVDDVSDSGDTLNLAVEHVRGFGPREVRTAVLHHKEVSYFVPDHFAAHVVRWRWIIYPWAVVEDLSGFISRMEDGPKDIPGIAERLAIEYGVRVTADTVEDVLAAMNPSPERKEP